MHHHNIQESLTHQLINSSIRLIKFVWQDLLWLIRVLGDDGTSGSDTPSLHQEAKPVIHPLDIRRMSALENNF